MAIIFILSGLPGSGKSTWAKKRASWRSDRGTIVSADSHFEQADGSWKFDPREAREAHLQCFRAYMRALENARPNDTIIVDNTNTLAAEIAPYYMAAEAIKSAVPNNICVLRFPCTVEESLARNTHNVPRETIERYYQNFERRDVMPWWRVETYDW